MNALSVLDKEEGNSISVQSGGGRVNISTLDKTEPSFVFILGQVVSMCDTFLVTVAEFLQREVHCYLHFFIYVNFFEAVGDGGAAS